MNHAQLRAFHTVAQKGGFTPAAKHLGLTQPAITIQVQALEKRYQTALFVRRGKSIELTAIGKRLVKISNRIFSLEEEAHQLLSSADHLESGVLKLATDSPLTAYIVTSEFHKKYPKIDISNTSLTAREARHNLLDHNIDLAIISEPVNMENLTKVTFSSSSWVAILWRDHPLVSRKNIAMKDLYNEDQICYRRKSDSWTRLRDTHPHHNPTSNGIIDIDNLEGLREAVANKIGIAVAPSSAMKNDRRLVSRTITDLHQETDICRYYATERASNRMIEAFVKLLKIAKL